MKPSLVGAIEAGGTKFVCAIGTDPQNIEEIRFPTTSPEETIQKARGVNLCAGATSAFSPRGVPEVLALGAAARCMRN